MRRLAADPIPRGRIRNTKERGLEGNSTPLFTQLLSVLSEYNEAGPIINKTGLSGLYDFKLEWSPDLGDCGVGPKRPRPAAPEVISAPSLFTALQEQLGLKLESAKGPVEVLVIDSVQRPTEN